MPNLLDTGARHLARTLLANASVPIMYSRGADSVDLRATIGRTEFDSADGEGGVIRFESRDYIVKASDLRLAGVRTTPRRGDGIREWRCGEWIDHEVVGIAGGQEWKPCDGGGVMVRIHTKQVTRT